MRVGAIVELPLDKLLLLENPPAGMDWSVVGHFAMIARKTAEPCEPPVEVFPIPGTDFWRVAEGRHRAVGALIGGRRAIRCQVVEDRRTT